MSNSAFAIAPYFSSCPLTWTFSLPMRAEFRAL